MKLQSALTLSLLSLPTASAFIPPSSKAFMGAGANGPIGNLEETQSARLNLLPDIIQSGGGDIITSSASSLSSISDPLNSIHLQQLLDSTSALLADAAEAVAEVDDGGWWGAYLSAYKGALTLVHSTIDQPLRDAGWDQTWGVSIFAFTMLVRTALLPLSIQQTKSTEYIKLLKPYQDEIKEKFKDNKDMQNRAVAKLFEDADANPLTGCLISLLQLPILIGLYRSITLLAKDGKLQEPFLFLPSLDGPVSPPEYRDMDWLLTGWTDGVPSLGWETTLAYLIMPVVLVLGQKLSMQVLTPETDKSKMSDEEREQTERTETILKFLPLLIGYFSLQVPSGLTIYWFTSNLFTVMQSLTIRGYYAANPPEITLPDYWDALDDIDSMSPDEKRKAAEAGMAVGPKWQDIVDEARYHYVIERKPLRLDSPAWERAQKEDVSIPTEMLSWVNAESNGVAELKVEVKNVESNGVAEAKVEEKSSKKETAKA